jgi:predicted nucleic acid-binding protein
VASGDDHAQTASQRRQEIEVHRSGPGRFVLRVGDEVRACADRDLADALRQALGLGVEDAVVLAATLRADARKR